MIRVDHHLFSGGAPALALGLLRYSVELAPSAKQGADCFVRIAILRRGASANRCGRLDDTFQKSRFIKPAIPRVNGHYGFVDPISLTESQVKDLIATSFPKGKNQNQNS